MRVVPCRAPAWLILALAACGGGSTGPTNGGNNNTPSIARGNPSGDAQTGAAGTALPNPLRVRITQGSSPVAGTTVNWAVASGGGSVNPPTSQTASDGTATTTLTLPNASATVTVTASASGVSGSPVSFTATSVQAGTNADVSVANNSFTPEQTFIRAGGTVTFTWSAGAIGHNVTPVAPNTIPISNNHPTLLNAPNSFNQVFNAVGTFVYFCSNHGTSSAGMRGTITVQP